MTEMDVWADDAPRSGVMPAGGAKVQELERLTATLLAVSVRAPHAVAQQIDRWIAKLEYDRAEPWWLAREAGLLAAHAVEDATHWDERLRWVPPGDGAGPEQLQQRALFYREVQAALLGGNDAPRP